MVNRYSALALALLLSVFANKVRAETSEQQAILTLMDNVFAAVQSSKADDWRALQLAEGTALSFRPDVNGPPGALEMRMSSNEEMIASIEPDGHEYIERWAKAPTILVRGPIAMVWGEYEFWIDGSFSHCGVDLVDLAKVDGEWKIANFTWTVEAENCSTAPDE